MRLTGPTRSVLHRLRLVMLVVAVLGVLSTDLAWPSVGLAKDFDVIGTVDCGIPSGKRCEVDANTLVLMTDSVTGVNELIAIDVSWIKDKLPALDQDDEITLSVELLPNGKLMALSIISAEKRDGTINQGHSTATREVTESRRDRGEKQDEDTDETRPVGGGISGRVVNQVTGAPISGATVRLNGTTVTTDSTGFFAILLTIESGTYQVEASAPLFASQAQTVAVQSAETTQVTFALQPIPGVLSGVVLNQQTGAPIPGATVQLNGATTTTDAAGGFAFSGLVPGTYQIDASAPLFFPSSQTVVIQATQTTPVTISLVPQGGVLSGIVRSLQTGAPIPGATVQVNGFTATTDATGSYAIVGIPPGAYQAEASAPGFISQAQPVTIQSNQTTPASFALPNAYPNLTFTLVWGAQPTDLDAHLSGPGTASPPRFHAYFLNPNPETYAGLTIDDQDGFGPEQIVVRPDPLTGLYVAGEYRFWVDNPNGPPLGPNYTVSQARVIVNRDSQFLGVFDVSAASGDPNLRLWHVANVQIDAAGNATILPIQQFTSGGPFTVLSPPYGAKPPRR